MIANTTYLTRLNNAAPEEGLGTELNRTKSLLKCYYDFAVQGGAFGATLLALKDDEGNDAFLPVGALITRTFVRVVTAGVSLGSATLAIQAVAAADVLAATAVASLTLAANIEGKATGTAANFSGPVTSTALTKNGTQGGGVFAVIGTAALTAGKVAVYIEYVI